MGTSKGYIPPKNREWKTAKMSVSRMINGDERKEGVKKAVGEYAKAYSSAHLNSSKIGVVAGKALDFFLNAKTKGLNSALKEKGLDALIGKSNEEIYLGLIEYFCTDNSTIEESVLRECIVEVLSNNDVLDLEDLDKFDGNKFIEDFIIKYIQVNFEVAFFEKIQGLCGSVKEANLRIKEINEYIDDSIRNLYEEELLYIDWKGAEGISFINEKCRKCYELLMLFEEE